MKRLMALCLVLALMYMGWALAEEAGGEPSLGIPEPVGLDGIDLLDVGTTALDSETEIEDVLSMTVHQTKVEASWRSMLADSRNKYLVVPVDVINLGMEALNVINSIKLTLNYKKYEFDPEMTVATDNLDSIVGEWKVYETDFDTKKMTSFRCVIRSIDANGKVDMVWGDYKPTNAYWNEKLQSLILDDAQRFRYQNGVLAGGGNGNRWRSVCFRTNPVGAAGDSRILGMLEEATFQYVFRCPNTVINHLDDCVLIAEVAGRKLTIKLN